MKNHGEITAYYGPMLASKTLQMIRQISGQEAVHRKVVVVKPDIDVRNPPDQICSRLTGPHAAISIPHEHPEEILSLLKGRTRLLAIDEIQFFDPSVVHVVLEADRRGIDVAFTCLNLNYRGEVFNATVKECLPLATKPVYLTASCMYPKNGTGYYCGEPAFFTQRLHLGQPDSYFSPTVIVEKDPNFPEYTYEARCPKHHIIPDAPKRR